MLKDKRIEFFNKNKSNSMYFEEAKFYRSELDKMCDFGRRSVNKSYAYYALRIMSIAVCENVDSENRIKIDGKKPQLYIEQRKLRKLFGVPSFPIALNVLENLKEKYNFLDYKIVSTSRTRYIKVVYIYIKKCIRKVPKGAYSRMNANAFSNAMAIKNNTGFFFVNKKELFDIFFKGNEHHGAEDLYILLRLNCVHDPDNTNGIVPEELRDCNIALWKLKNDQYDAFGNEIKFIFYLRQKELAKFLNIKIKTLQKYMTKLRKIGMIDNIYLQKRGTMFLFPELDRIMKVGIFSDSYNNFDDPFGGPPDNDFGDYYEKYNYDKSCNLNYASNNTLEDNNFVRFKKFKKNVKYFVAGFIKEFNKSCEYKFQEYSLHNRYCWFLNSPYGSVNL